MEKRMKKSERYQKIEREVQMVLGFTIVPLIVLFIILIEWVWREVKRGVDRA